MPTEVGNLKRIIDQLEIILKTITTTNGYNTNVGGVFTKISQWLTFNDCPAIYLDYETGDDELYPGEYAKIEDGFKLYVKFRETLETDMDFNSQMAKFLRDLRTLFYTNNSTLIETSSGTALVSRIKIGKRDTNKTDFQPFGILTVNVEVTYCEDF